MKTIRLYVVCFLIICTSSLSQNNYYLNKIKQADSLFAFNKDSSIRILKDLTSKLKLTGQPYELASAYKSLGLCYYYKANYPDALFNYQQSEKLVEQYQFADLELSLKNLLGTFYKKQKLYKKAMFEFEKGYELAVTRKDSSLQAGLLGDIGLVYAELNDYKRAKFYFERSLDIYLKTKNQVGASYAYDYLAEAVATSGNFKEAIILMKKGLAIRELLHDARLIAVNLNNIGEIYLQQKDYQNAISYLNKSVELSEKINYNDLLQHSLGLLSECYRETGNYRLAYEFNEQKDHLKDSIYNERNSQIIHEAEEKYQSAKKQSAIDKLSAANSISEVKVSKQKNIILFFVIILIIVVLAFFIIAKYYRKVKKSHRIITQQHLQTEHQKKIIEEKQHEILDSINYAKRIQTTIFAQDKFLKEHLSDNYFVLFKPKDIVSGDFYWATSVRSEELGVRSPSSNLPEQRPSNSELFYLAVCDSTGHGVPGAFMSLLNIGYLSEAINEKNISETGRVFNYVRNRLITSVSKDGQKDGFDGALLSLSFNRDGTKKLTYSAAYNSPLLISNHVATSLRADKMPVGIGEKNNMFATNTVDVKPGDVLYLFTDGYADQFGGPKGKKFKYKPLEELLLNIHQLPLNQQRSVLDKSFEEWRGALEQVDDILIVGIQL